MVMVKPALAVPRRDRARARRRSTCPVAAYHVSGEYAMVQAAAAQRLDRRRRGRARARSLSIKRAGADFVLTYFARERRRTLCMSGRRDVSDRCSSARSRGIPGGVELAGAGVRRGRRRAVLRRARRGRVPRRHRRQPLPRLRAVVGRVDPRARPPARSSRRCSGPRPTARRSARPPRARSSSPRRSCDAGAVGREGAARVVGHRGRR